ncbi:hypothetical protein GCM10023157_04300 [Gluconacetobacter asukensis]
MDEPTNYLVPAKLTDEQCDLLENALLEAEDKHDAYDKWIAISSALGMPVEASGLETVRWGPSYTMPGRPSLFASKRKAEHWATTPGRSIVAFVSKSDAAVQITARDAKIAELTAKLDTIAQETREACARICEQQREDFADPQYAGGEMGAFQERFACAECAKAIRHAGESS